MYIHVYIYTCTCTRFPKGSALCVCVRRPEGSWPTSVQLIVLFPLLLLCWPIDSKPQTLYMYTHSYHACIYTQCMHCTCEWPPSSSQTLLVTHLPSPSPSPSSPPPLLPLPLSLPLSPSLPLSLPLSLSLSSCRCLTAKVKVLWSLMTIFKGH